nr:uncharacterized protein LOC107446482 isoform X2 [Parasteatoda tepidariorum]
MPDIHSKTTISYVLGIVYLFAAAISPTVSQDFSLETCGATVHHVNVEKGADVTIGAILPIHQQGEGVYGCGNPTHDGVQVFEAMRWAVDVLNRKSGLISDSGGSGGGSLIPGVKIGLKVYDSCGHNAMAVEHLTSLFPVLRSGPKTCDSFAKNSSLTIGVVDMSDSSNQPQVSESLRDYLIPSIELSLTTLIPPERMAQVLLSASNDLHWSNIVILHEDEEYSISVTKHLTQSAATNRAICISSIYSLPKVDSSYKTNKRDLRPFRKVFRAATSGLAEGSAVIVIMKREETATRFLQVLAEFPELIHEIQWLFSWIPPSTPMTAINRHLSPNSNVYSVAPYPDKIKQFEDYWSGLRRSTSLSNIEDKWFLEYFMAQKGCKLQGAFDPKYRGLPFCENSKLEESMLDVLHRTSRAVPALTSVFTLATAFHKAWESKCHNNPGICPELRTMMRKEFVSQYLEPVEFLVGGESGELGDTRRRAPRQRRDAKLEGSKLSLTRYVSDKERGVAYHQLIVYESQGSQVLDKTFVSRPSTCGPAGCRGCVRPRQSRLEDSLQDLDSAESTLFDVRQDDIVIPILLPLHQEGLSPFECGSILNAEAVQNLEAALWTVDRINEDKASLGGARLGLKVIDTCSSSLLATQKVATYFTNSHLDSTAGLAVVSVASPEETLAAASVLKPLNISVVSTMDVTSLFEMEGKSGHHPHLFQITAPIESRIEAALGTFDYIGWKFVTVVYENTPLYSSALQTLSKVAKVKGVCVGQQLEIPSEDWLDSDVDRLIQTLVETKSQGSSVVVTLTSRSSTRKILSGIGRFLEASALQPGDLVLVGLGEWDDSTQIIDGLERIALGSVIFKQERGEVSEFAAHYQRLLPTFNPRNPWFDELWHQQEVHSEMTAKANISDKMPPVYYISSESTTNTIQALIAVVAGIADTRNQLCQIEFGVCSEMIRHPHLLRLVGEHIATSKSPRLDHPGQAFQFNERRFGATPIEVYNYRKVTGGDINYLKVGSFEGQYTKLADMMAYTPSGEVPMESILSTCIKDCYRCQQASPNYLTIPSTQGIYIAVAQGIHESTSNPLTCGPIRVNRGFQNFQALQWALKIINSDPTILPGIDLGLVVFDTCNSREKAAMDVSNFLTGTIAEKQQLPAPDDVVGFLVDDAGDIVHPLADLTQPLQMTTVASTAIAPEFGDVKKYHHLLKMKMPSDVIISSMVYILRHYHWKFVSVVYNKGNEDTLFGLAGVTEFKRQIEEHGIELALEESIGTEEESVASTMDIIAHRLKIKQNAGAKVVILFLPPTLISALMSAVKRLQHVGRSSMGDFVWVAYDSLEPFQMFPDQSVGAVVVRPPSEEIPVFKDYFTSLNIKESGQDHWLKEYWEQVFSCRGGACSTNQHRTLHQVGFIQDKTVANTVNALFTLALGLDGVQRELCPIKNNWCSMMKNKLLVRHKLFSHARKVRFNGLDGVPVVFGAKNYVKGELGIYNFKDVGDVRAFMNIGLFHEDHGLAINTSMTSGYNEKGDLVPLSEIQSFCNDSEICSKKQDAAALMSMPFMKIPANQEFVIGVMLPIHQPGDNFFTCSRAVEETSFQNLMALSYALNKINANETILPQIQLGALVFDHCGRRQKAEEQIFSFIASDGSLPYSEANLKSRAMIAAVTYDPQVADDLSPLFESALIPQISTPAATLTDSPEWQRRRNPRSASDSNLNPEVRVLVDVLKKFNWRFVSLIHSDSESDRNIFWNFIQVSKEKKICISEGLVIKPDMDIVDIAALLLQELDTRQESKVIVLLLEEHQLVQKVLEAAKRTDLVEHFVWIGMESQKDGRSVARILQGIDIDYILIRPETYEVPGFLEYYTTFSLNKHESIPDLWFEEFWQHHFRCHLPQSISSLEKLFPLPCTGTESLSQKPLNLDTFVYHTVVAVTGVAESLHDYLRRYCVHGDAATNLDDCGADARQILWREMRKFMKGPPLNCADGDCGPLKMSMGYQIFQLRKAKIHHVYQQIGLWKDEELALKLEDVEFIGGVKVDSTCKRDCDKCLEQLVIDPEELNQTKPSLYANFRTLWGVIVTAVSLLGVLLVIICAAYFLISFQVTVGTTVLGYMILFGLLLLYAVNFAFILTPTEGTCGVRRFGLGLSYAIIFSGMLVKVMNIWRMMGYRGNHFFGDVYHMTNPAALLVVAVGLVIIQVILSAAWLILIPPTTGLHAGEWRCHPATTFEDELVISLVYVMLMLAITMLFSILTWSSKDNNKESRWIFTCCFLISLVWVTWTILSTQIIHKYRDLTISAANLICASIVMLCMYLRKVYIYNKLTKDEENKAKLQQTASMPVAQNVYGTLTRPAPIPGPRVSGLGSKLADRAPSSRMALIASEDGNTSDSGSGSTQVQATDLYPLDMYDGGSQFQPPSLRLGGSSLVLEELGQNNTGS